MSGAQARQSRQLLGNPGRRRKSSPEVHGASEGNAGVCQRELTGMSQEKIKPRPPPPRADLGPSTASGGPVGQDAGAGCHKSVQPLGGLERSCTRVAVPAPVPVVQNGWWYKGSRRLSSNFRGEDANPVRQKLLALVWEQILTAVDDVALLFPQLLPGAAGRG